MDLLFMLPRMYCEYIANACEDIRGSMKSRPNLSCAQFFNDIFMGIFGKT